jgi:O-antigen ligase
VWLIFYIIYIWIGTLITVSNEQKGWLAAADLRVHWEFTMLAFVTSTISRMDWCKRIFYMLISGGVVSALVGLISKWAEGSLFDLSFRSMGILGGMISVNGYGLFFAIIILALLSLLLWDYKLGSQPRKLSIITLAIMMLSLLITYSRGAWLSGLIGISVIIWLITKSQVLRTRILTLFIVLLFAVFLIAEVPYVQYRILQIIPGWVTDDPTQTLEGRLSQWRLELASLQVPQLLLGSGLGSSGSYLSRHLTLHNYYLLLLKETGLVGLGLYVGTIVSSLIGIWRRFRSSDSFAKVISATALATLITVTVGGFFDYVNTSIPVAPTMWILVGMSVAAGKTDRLFPSNDQRLGVYCSGEGKGGP